MKNILLITLFLSVVPHSIGKSFNDLVTADDVKTVVKQLAVVGDWEKLNQLEGYLNHDEKLTDNGLPMVDMYYAGFREFINSQKDGPGGWELLEKRIHEWVRKSPNSPASHLALGEVLHLKSASIRGTGYANTVSESQWLGQRKHVEILRKHLLDHKAVASRDPEWYTLMLAATKILSMPESDYERILDEGLAKFPNHYRLYLSGAIVMLPKWGGSYPQLEAYLNEKAGRFNAAKRDEIYSITYLRLLETKNVDLSYEPVGMDCERVVRGLEKFTSKFATASNYGNLVYFATICGKKEVAQKYFDKVGEIPDSDLWGNNPNSRRNNFSRVKALSK